MNCIAHRDPRRELINTLKKETNLILDSMTPSSAFATLIRMKQGEKTQKLWLNTYMIASAKEIDALNITLFNSCINFANVHLCNYCTKIFVINVNTRVCRRSVNNKALILSYPTNNYKIFYTHCFGYPELIFRLKTSFPSILFRFLETNVCWNQSSYAKNVPLTFAKVTTLFL